MISLSEMKKALRISHNALDEDIQSSMNAAVLDAQRVGVVFDEDNELTDTLVKLYVKAEMNLNDKGEQYRNQYERLRNALSMSEGYKQ